MPNTQFFQPLIDYVPAKLTEGKEWFVSFYAINPLTNKLQRRRIKCNLIESIPERRRQAKRLVAKINHQLAHGWNPFVEEVAPKSFNKLFDVLDVFIRGKESELAKNSFRADSMRTYKSFINTFKIYLNWIKKTDIYVFNFSRQDAINFMNWVYTVLNVSDLTYNPYIGFFYNIFNWKKTNLYVVENHFDEIENV